MLASVTSPLAPAPTRSDNAAASPPAPEAEARPRAFRELVGSGRPQRAEADVRAETRRRTGVPVVPAPMRQDGRKVADEKAGGGAEAAGGRESVQARTGKPATDRPGHADEKPMNVEVTADVGAMPGAQRSAAAGAADDETHQQAATDIDSDPASTDEVEPGTAEKLASAGVESAVQSVPEPEAPAAPIVGDGGVETEGYAEMLASAAAGAASDGSAVPAAPVPVGAPAPSASVADPDPVATAAVLAVAGDAGAPAKADVRTTEALALADSAAGGSSVSSAAEKNGAAGSQPPGARASVPLVPGRAGVDLSILVNPNAAPAQASDGGGMGIAEKLAAAKQPKAGADQAFMASLRAGTSESSVRPTDVPANFNHTLNEIALSNGFVHRSGDLVGALDRMTAGPGVQPGAAALRPTPVQMLPIEIGMQALRGTTQFQIRLDPAELGRIEVTLDIKEDGEVKASLVVDRVETLALLKREAPNLQQAFEQAGLRQNADGLSFSLRGEGQQHSQREERAERSHAALQDDENLRLKREIGEIALRRVLIPNSSLDRVV